MLDFVQIGEILDEGGDRFAARFAERADAIGSAIQASYFPRVPVGLDVMVMERAQVNRAIAIRLRRARTGGPTQSVGGAQPGAERL